MFIFEPLGPKEGHGKLDRGRAAHWDVSEILTFFSTKFDRKAVEGNYREWGSVS